MSNLLPFIKAMKTRSRRRGKRLVDRDISPTGHTTNGVMAAARSSFFLKRCCELFESPRGFVVFATSRQQIDDHFGFFSHTRDLSDCGTNEAAFIMPSMSIRRRVSPHMPFNKLMNGALFVDILLA